jgi:hypothetical protein
MTAANQNSFAFEPPPAEKVDHARVRQMRAFAAATRLKSKPTQCDRIFEVLRDANGEWVPLPKILALGIAQYNARIFQLRAAGHNIENRTEEVDGETHSWYRLL